MTQKWQRREISNFEYLMFLNTIAGKYLPHVIYISHILLVNLSCHQRTPFASVHFNLPLYISLCKFLIKLLGLKQIYNLY